MKNEDVPILSFEDLGELDDVIEQLRDFSKLAAQPGAAPELQEHNPFPSLLRRLSAQERIGSARKANGCTLALSIGRTWPTNMPPSPSC